MAGVRPARGMRPPGGFDDRPAPARAPATIALAGLLALAVAMGIGRFAFTPILPMMQHDRGMSVAAGGWLAAANYLGYFLGAASVSVLARRVRAAAGIRGGLVVIAAATLGMGIAEGFAAWLVLRALAGIGSAAVLVLASAWCLERLASARRPLLNGAVFAGVGVGIAAAGGTSLFLMRSGAPAAQAWLALGTLSLVATAAVWPVFTPGSATPLAGGRGRPRWSADRVRLVICYGAFGFGYIIPGTFLPSMARQIISDPVVFGWAWPLFGAAAALSTLAAAGAARSVGYRRLLVLSQLVALPVVRPGLAGIMASALLVGGTFMVITLTGMQEARALAGPDAAPLMGTMTTAFAAGQIAGPICVSYLAGVAPGFSAPLLIAGAVLLVGAGVPPTQSGQDALGAGTGSRSGPGPHGGR
jgi:MFS family permease